MNLYSRARKHIDMKRVKEMREEKIKREQIAEILRQQEEIRAELEYIEAEESKYINWRSELEEGMTTSGMGMINLPAQGDVDIVDTEATFDTIFSSLNATVSGGEVILAGTENSIVGGTHTIYRRAMFSVDGSKSSTLKLTISKGGGTSSWTDRDPAESFNDNVKINVYQGGVPGGPSYYNANLSSGTHLISLPGQFKTLRIQIEQFAKVSETGSLRITNASLQRRTPLNVFVPLDDPEANSFLRDGQTDNLSPGEKKKKLEEQLASSKEYLNKMFGEGMPNTATTIADYEPQQSFADIALGTEYGSQSTYGTKPDGTQGFPEPGELNKGNDGKWYEYAPGGWVPIPSVDAGGGDTEVASARGPYGTPGADKPYTRKGYKDKDGKFVDFDNPATWPKIPKADKKKPKQTTMVADYKPKGLYISEKKSFKDLTKKIPGYYDGKPAPLGFPIVEPPKMKNGFHPDLVNGKKVANRFNRLDPQSAESMPSTGNPTVDTNVKKATNTKEKSRKLKILLGKRG